MKETYDDYFPSDYLKAADLPQPVTLTIKNVAEVTIGQEDQAETKPAVYFNEMIRALVLNKTNNETISKIAGSDRFLLWGGKKIVLYKTEVLYKGKMVPAIRVRAP